MLTHESYNKVQDLAKVVFSVFEKRRFMVMMAAYFDECGTPDDSQIFTVGGYLAPVDEWEKFQVPWAQSLKDAGVEYFRMSEIENRWGQFQGWDKEKKEAFLARHLNIINSHALRSMSASVVVKDYEELRTEKKFPFGPYAFCFAQCFKRINDWASRPNRQWSIDYVLERGAKGMGEIGAPLYQYMGELGLLNEFSNSRISLVPKRKLLPLQAADFIAYEAWKNLSNLYQNPERDERKSFTLSLPVGHYSYWYGKGLTNLSYEKMKRAAEKRAATKDREEPR